MNDTRKDLERSSDDPGTAGDAVTSTEIEGCRITYKLYRVREQSKGAKTDPRDARNRATSVEVREKDRNKNNRIRDIM